MTTYKFSHIAVEADVRIMRLITCVLCSFGPVDFHLSDCFENCIPQFVSM